MMIVAEIDQQRVDTPRRFDPFTNYAPAVIALLTFWAVTGFLYAWTTARTGGAFTYGLDDAYIHLAIARDIALHGVWGVTRYDFTSATSSPLWTLIIAALYRLHQSSLIPLSLNILLGSIAIWQASRILRRYQFGFWFSVALLELFEFATPLPRLALTGMEHLLQIVAVIAFIDTFASIYTASTPTRRELATYYILCLLLPVIRYESILMLVVAAVFLFSRKRGAIALRGLLLALLLTTAFGIFSMAHGAYFVPNSVLLKAAFSAVPITGGGVWQQIEWQVLVRVAWLSFLFVLFACAGCVLSTSRFGWRKPAAGRFECEHLVVWLFFIMCAGHLLGVGDPYSVRYEAYLVAVGLIWPVPIALRYALDELAARERPVGKRTGINPSTVAVVTVAAVLLLLFRGSDSYRAAMMASINIYDQQGQMARFVKTYCPGAAVAVNDIGSVCYFTDVHCLDLVGLADRNVARERVAGRYGSDSMQRLAASMSVSLAMLYDGWFRGGRGHFPKVPASWQKIGTLSIENNAVCAETDVSFYATSPATAGKLSDDLRAFSATVPPGVHVSVVR